MSALHRWFDAPLTFREAIPSLLQNVAAVIGTEFEEATLVRAAQAGDRAAFGMLYERYARMVHGILLAHCWKADTEDLVQEVFVRALEQLHSLREPRAFGGWLAAVARRLAADSFRTRRAQDKLRDRRGATLPDYQAFEVLDVIRGLPNAYRETLMLRLVEGMTGPEIAERIGLKPESVRVNLCRGMKQLREALGGSFEHG
jgi:RNA polymerase sigma-70 factor, ECF subfamily